MHDEKPNEEYSLVPSEPQVDNDSTTYTILTEKGKPKTLLWSLLSLIFGILSVALSIFGWVGIALGVCTVVFSIIGRKGLGFFNGLIISGLLSGIFGVVFSIAIILATHFFPSFNIF